VHSATTTARVASSGRRVITIRRGDTLSGIAARYGVSVSDLLEANGLQRDSVIKAGHKLTIPGA
jgi:LysM repeat protein